MKFRLYHLSALILFLIWSVNGFSQSTYTVSNVTSGSSNSIDVIIPLAVTDANSGQNVTVYFNASGLCNIAASLPVITTTAGSITFKKSPLAGVDQGLTATTSGIYGIQTTGSMAGATVNKIYLENLHINNFNIGVQSIFTTTLSINTCTFTNNETSIAQYGEAFRNTTITNSTFSLTSGYTGAVDGKFIWIWAHGYDGAANGYTVPPGTMNQTSISSNLFSVAPTLSLTSKFTAVYIFHQNDAYGRFLTSAFSILNNTVTTTHNGFYLADNLHNSNANPESMSSYDIENNQLTNYNYNVFFLNPHYDKIVKNNKFHLDPITNQQLIQSKLWDIDNNSSNIVLSSIALDGEGGGDKADPAGIKFINSNTLGYTVENDGNEFKILNNTYQSTSFYVTGNFERGVYIIGQDLEAEIKIDTSFYTYGGTHLKSFYTHIRQNTIKSNNVSNKPIELIRGGNDYLKKPVILSASRSGNNLAVSYNLGGNSTLHQPGVVDFYETNTNGDLLGYIGYVNQSDISSAAVFNQVFNVSAFSSLTRIAATITTFGVMGVDSVYGYYKDDDTGESGYKWIVFPVILQQQLGTSEASYISVNEYTSICGDASIFIPEGRNCINTLISVSAIDCCNPEAVYNWSFGDGLTATGNNVTHSYQSAGTYVVQLTVVQAGQPDIIKTTVITIADCIETSCKDCIGSFQPSPGNYIVSLWVREDVSPLPQTYNNAKVEINFITAAGTLGPITIGTNSAKNKIIDGWQRIEESFTIPANATDLKLKLVNSSATTDAYFDDIRVFPVDGQMKTYVYDPISLRLTATLDENNYATFYEYDEEGKLIRVKKETEKGVMTIQESREGNKKK
jgi:hypothetical protein